jgi:osmotically-inducible protein OsmY
MRDIVVDRRFNFGGTEVPQQLVSYTMQQRKRITAHLAIAAMCSLLLLASGCQTAIIEAPVKVPTTETPQDEALSKSVRDRLHSVKTLDLSSVKVVSSAGTVYLTGTVASLDARQQAIKHAWTVPGVQSVVNALEVQK